ncbi:MAG TPA: VWA domain-containing protein, partial [Polyangiaceae bacterium]
STSHALTLRRSGAAPGVLVGLAGDAGATLDRDVVVAWPVAAPAVGVALDVARPATAHPRSNSAFALLTVVPPRLQSEPVPRDLIVLLDTSGSMSGEPLDQAKRVVSALIAGLGPRDRLELIEFSVRPRRFRPQALEATPAHKAEALAWLEALSASGGTEMHAGIVEALAPLRAGAQRQVLLVTDGLIGAEERIVAEVLDRLPQGSRVHTLGIGSGVNRSLTGPVARAGRGSEQIAELGSDVGPVVARVLAHLERPLLVDLELTGAALRSLGGTRLPDLMGGAPALLAIEVDPEGGELELRGQTAAGVWSQRVVVPPTAAEQGNEAVPALFARERVLDLEMRIAGKAPRDELERDIERLGLDFGISTRLTSWVAVSKGATVDPTRPTRHVTRPQALPHGMSVAGLGLRAARAQMPPLPSPMMAFAAPSPASPARAFAPRGAVGDAALRARVKGIASPQDVEPAAPPPAPTMARAMEDDDTPHAEPAHVAYFHTPRRSPRNRQVLPGRLAFHKGGRWVVEVTLETSWNWSLPERANLELADGTRVTVEVVQEHSTASGLLHAGQTLRLVLLHTGAPAGAVSAVALDDVWIDLTGATR